MSRSKINKQITKENKSFWPRDGSRFSFSLVSLLFRTSLFLSFVFQSSLLLPFEICVNLSRHTGVPLYFCRTFPLPLSLLFSLHHTPASSNSAVFSLFSFLSLHFPTCLVCAATVFHNCDKGSLFHSAHLLQMIHCAPP